MKHDQKQLGRGIIKWQPFASIPQQFAGVTNIIENQRKIPQPILEEDEQERINFILNEALEFKREITIVYWSKGYLHNEIGYIHKVDHIHKTFQFHNHLNQLQMYTFDAIVDIRFN